MKKIICTLLALAMMVCGFAMAEAIAPQFTELNTTDATYSACAGRASTSASSRITSNFFIGLTALSLYNWQEQPLLL